MLKATCINLWPRNVTLPTMRTLLPTSPLWRKRNICYRRIHQSLIHELKRLPTPINMSPLWKIPISPQINTDTRNTLTHQKSSHPMFSGKLSTPGASGPGFDSQSKLLVFFLWHSYSTAWKKVFAYAFSSTLFLRGGKMLHKIKQLAETKRI